MRIFRDLFTIPDTARGAVIALGNFDGVHLGHQAILRHTVELARRAGKPAAAMTFEPHPREFFAPGATKLRLYPFRSKAERIAELGIDLLFAPRFNAAFAQRTAQAFIDTLLVGQLRASHVVTGENFHFGQQRQGDKDWLARGARELGFAYTALPPVCDAQGHTVSSSAIRAALTAGDMPAAAALLGRAYHIEGRVRHGDKRGRQLGFPTLNINVDQLFLPKFGVYAARVSVDAGKSWHEGVANLGIRPSIGGQKPLLEAHCFDFAQDVYGVRAQVQLIACLRAEQTFASLTALREQIQADCAQARYWLKGYKRGNTA